MYVETVIIKSWEKVIIYIWGDMGGVMGGGGVVGIWWVGCKQCDMYDLVG